MNILNEDYILDSHFSIYVNDEKIEAAKSYEFPSVGVYEIKYIFYDNKINLNYMFKNIDSLISVEMKSNTSAIIINLISTFENCIKILIIFH